MVKGLLLWAGLFLFAAVCVSWGVLTIFSPETLQRFTDWYTGATKWSTRKPGPTLRAPLLQRLAGIVPIAIGTWMIVTLVSHLFAPRAGISAHVRKALPEAAGRGHHWTELIAGLVIIAAGGLLVGRPEINLRLTRANFPHRELSQKAIDQARRGGRVLGALTILFGAYVLLLWYRWSH